MRESLGVELVLAGSALFGAEEVGQILNHLAESLKPKASLTDATLKVEGCGRFSFREVDPSWSTKMLLGAYDYYGSTKVAAFQVVPDEPHWTVDVPDMSRHWTAADEPVWQWLYEPWQYAIPSLAITDIRALRGAQITEASRWEEDRWELFAGNGPDVPDEETRVVPLGTLVAADPSLRPVVDLSVGTGLWRVAGSRWNHWTQSTDSSPEPG